MLLEFLEFYGRSLDTQQVGISVRGQGTLYRKNSRSFFNPNRPHLLSLENPENPSVDIGANSYAYKGIQRAVCNSYETVKAALNTALQSNDRSASNRSLLSLIIDIDAARSDSRTQTKREPMVRRSSGGGRRGGRGGSRGGGGRGGGRGGRGRIPMSRR